MPAQKVTRTLLVRSKEHMTDGIMQRRAAQLARILDAQHVEIEKGSVPDGRSWVFGFYKNAYTPESEPFLVLRVLGTRGEVYTALGNYAAGADYGKS